jgi:hypothetical protein
MIKQWAIIQWLVIDCLERCDLVKDVKIEQIIDLFQM